MCLKATSKFEEIRDNLIVYVMRTVTFNGHIHSPITWHPWEIGVMQTIPEQDNFKVGDCVEGGVFHVFLTKELLMSVVKSPAWQFHKVKPFKAIAYWNIIYGTLYLFDNEHEGAECAGVTELKLIEELEM